MRDLPLEAAIADPAQTGWNECFLVGDPGGDGSIHIRQLDKANFALESRVEYLEGKETGLEHLDLSKDDLDVLRVVNPHDLRNTDLASVPGPFRWWTQSYGIHTPAALIHDKFIGHSLTSDIDDPGIDHGDGSSGDGQYSGPAKIYRPASVTDANIDRYFRYMLAELGVTWLRRWVMWSAVASRSRWLGGRRKMWGMVAWGVLVLVGAALLAWSLYGSKNVAGIWISMLLPLAGSLLWGRQWGAGIIFSYFAVPLLLPPSIVAIPYLLTFFVAEHTIGAIRAFPGRTTRRWRD